MNGGQKHSLAHGQSLKLREGERRRLQSEVKEILIDLVNYYNTMGTQSDPGIEAFQSVAQRASKALERDAANKRLGSADVDPYSFDVVGTLKEVATVKHESEL